MRIEDVPFMSGGAPLVGHIAELAEDRIAFMRRVAGEVDRVARIRTIGHGVFVNHPEPLQEVLVEKARSFDKSRMTRWALYPLGGDGLFTSSGDLWRRQRKLMAPLFHPAQLERYAADMVACATRAVGSWRDGQVVELARETTRITMGVAGKTLFDSDTFDEADELGAALTVALEWTADHAPSFSSIAHLVTARTLRDLGELGRSRRLGELAQRFEVPLVLPGKDGRALREAVAYLDAHVQRMIDARRAAADHAPDLLSRLLAARDDEGGRMSDKQVRDEVLTLFVAGHETTATALAWSIHCLCNHPEIAEAVQREADALPGPPTFADLPRLPLALRVFKEALRLYPPVYFFGRQAIEPVTVDGVSLPRDTVVLIAPHALHRRPELYPDPERFDPDRFLPEQEAARPKLAWLPFGAGPRVCIGNHFAMMEGQLVLAELLRHARFEAIGVDTPDPGATLRPAGGMKMRVRLRRTARSGAVGREPAAHPS